MTDQNSNMHRQTSLDPQNVPEVLRPLISYAEKWGISDDGDRGNAIDEASIEELKELLSIVSTYVDGINVWLGNPDIDNPTTEFISFVLLVDACDLAKIRLRRHKS
jgi:hypothetical protein